MPDFLLEALALGFAAGAQPGAMQAYLISRAARGGWRLALPAAFAPLASDGPAILLSTALLVSLPQAAQRVLFAAGGLFLLWLAYGAFRRWRAGEEGEGTAKARAAGFLQAVAMNLFNPAPFLFWSLVSGPILVRAWSEAPARGVAFLAAFYAALIGVNATIVLLFGLAAGRGARARRTLQGLSALAMVGFALLQLWRAVSPP